MRSIRVPIFMLVLLLAVPVGGSTANQVSPAVDAINAMLHTARGNLTAHVAPATGSYDFIDAVGTAVIARDDASASPKARAAGFLRRYGSAIGMSPAERGTLESVLRVQDIYTDPAGNTHVRYLQMHRDREVFGGSVVVHLSWRGVTGVSGTFVQNIAVAKRPAVSRSHARNTALNAVAKTHKTTDLEVASTDLTIFRSGLIEERPGSNRLAYQIDVAGDGIGERVMIDAKTGIVLRRIPTIHTARDRIAYSPQYDPHNPDRFALRRENSPPSMIPPVDRLFEFTGQVYDLYRNTFGRDSFDGKGKTMRTVYLINQVCPNAYWNSSTTNYCPGFDTDDVVAHEWAHAYTEYTHGLFYSCEPGALNESYSDIYGEIIDLTNKMDGIGGSNNDEPAPDGQRWLVGEDLGQPIQNVLLRDMWDPQATFFPSPAKVSDAEFVCNNQSDAGGVHTNSGIPNHAFAMLVDGKTFNGVTVKGIGLTKAAHIYYQAMTAYQTPTSGFETHALALQASCADLAGVDLRALNTGAPSGERIASGDCAQVTNAANATEMFEEPEQCAFEPLLDPKPQPVCPAAQVFLNETWESGSDGWTFGNQGVTEDFPDIDWTVRGNLPERKGRSAFASDPSGGVCLESAGDWSGRYWMDSPVVTIPDAIPNLTLRFDHYVATEVADGGNVAISVNGGDFTLLDTYTFNEPTGALPAAQPDGNTNPKAGETAWFTADPGEVEGSWGTTLADLSEVVEPGDTVKLRFEFGIDGCGGIEGWYVDDIAIYSCPEIPAPQLSLRDAGNPDADREVTLSWTRPAGGVGPDEVQRSSGDTVVFHEDAESGTDGWTITTNGAAVLGWDNSELKSHSGAASFAARALEAPVAGESILERDAPIAVPKKGDTILQWQHWYAGESDDAAIVEVHDGQKWVAVKKLINPLFATESAPDFLTGPFEVQSVDLGERFAGNTVRLRFRYTVGRASPVLSTPLFGWHIDDITVTSALWQTVAKPGKALARLAGLADGTHVFRVRTSYRNGFGAVAPGPWSNTVSAKVKGAKTVVRGGKQGGQLPATGVGTPLVAFLLLGGAAVGVRTLRRA